MYGPPIGLFWDGLRSSSPWHLHDWSSDVASPCHSRRRRHDRPSRNHPMTHWKNSKNLSTQSSIWWTHERIFCHLMWRKLQGLGELTRNLLLCYRGRCWPRVTPESTARWHTEMQQMKTGRRRSSERINWQQTVGHCSHDLFIWLVGHSDVLECVHVFCELLILLFRWVYQYPGERTVSRRRQDKIRKQGAFLHKIAKLCWCSLNDLPCSKILLFLLSFRWSLPRETAMPQKMILSEDMGTFDFSVHATRALASGPSRILKIFAVFFWIAICFVWRVVKTQKLPPNPWRMTGLLERASERHSISKLSVLVNISGVKSCLFCFSARSLTKNPAQTPAPVSPNAASMAVAPIWKATARSPRSSCAAPVLRALLTAKLEYSLPRRSMTTVCGGCTPGPVALIFRILSVDVDGCVRHTHVIRFVKWYPSLIVTIFKETVLTVLPRRQELKQGKQT